MKRLVLLLLLSFPCAAQMVMPVMGAPMGSAGGGQTPPTFVHSCIGITGATGANCTLSTTANNLIVAYMYAIPTTGALSTFTCCGSNETVTIEASEVSADRAFRTAFWVGIAAGGSDTFTATATAAGGISTTAIEVEEWSGSQSTVGAAVEATCVGTTSGSATSTQTCGSALSFTNGDAVIAGTGTTSQYTWTVGAGLAFDKCLIAGGSCGSSATGATAEATNMTSTVTPTFTTSGSNAFWNINGIAIKGH